MFWLLHHLHGFGGILSQLAGEVGRLAQALLELPEAGGHVALVLQGGQVRLVAAIRRLAAAGPSVSVRTFV